MQVDIDTAVAAYQSLPLKCPYQDPVFVVGDAARDPALQPVFLVYRESGEIFYLALHLAEIPEGGGRDLQSPYPYGGPLASANDPGFLSRAWENYLSWCHRQEVMAEFIRFHPLVDNSFGYPGEVNTLRETVWVDLTVDNLAASYSPRARTAIRKAEKNGLRVVWSDPATALDTFPALYRAAMTAIGAAPFYFFPESYFRRLLAWDRVYTALCYREDELLAGAIFIEGGSQIIEYHLSAATVAGKKACAANLLLHQAAWLGKEMGCRALHLGGGGDNRPDNPLLFFKAGFSKRRGQFRIGSLIHNPESYRELRRKWCQRFGTVADRVLFYRFPPP